MGERHMHTARKEADERQCLRFGKRVLGPKVKSLAQKRQNSCVLGPTVRRYREAAQVRAPGGLF